MAEVKWIKIVTDIFDDEKIQLIEAMPDNYAIIVCWFKLLCFAGKQNNGGAFMLNDRIAYTDEMLATVFRMNLNTVKLALGVFEKFGMIVIADDVIKIKNWSRYQSIQDKQTYNEYMAELMRRRRAEKKLLEAGTESVSNDVNNNVSNVREQEEEIRNKKEKEKKEEDSTKAAKRFTRPTFEEVEAYCFERKNKVNAQRFLDYYDSNGWKVGKNPMKDWKAAVRNWEREDGKQAEKAKKPMDERKVSEDEFAWNPMDLMNRPRKGA